MRKILIKMFAAVFGFKVEKKYLYINKKSNDEYFRKFKDIDDENYIYVGHHFILTEEA